MNLLVTEGLGLRHFITRMPITKIQSQQIIHHRSNATLLHFCVKRHEVVLVISIFVGDIEDRETPIINRGGHDPIRIGGHDYMQPILVHGRIKKFRFNHQGIFGYDALERAFG